MKFNKIKVMGVVSGDAESPEALILAAEMAANEKGNPRLHLALVPEAPPLESRGIAEVRGMQRALLEWDGEKYQLTDIDMELYLLDMNKRLMLKYPRAILPDVSKFIKRQAYVAPEMLVEEFIMYAERIGKAIQCSL